MKPSVSKKKIRSEKPKEYTAHFAIKGVAWLTVTASSIEEAEEKAWAAYHAGELQDLEWDADDLEVEETA